MITITNKENKVQAKQSKVRATYVTTTVQVTAHPVAVTELDWSLENTSGCSHDGNTNQIVFSEVGFDYVTERPLCGHDIVPFDGNYVSNCQVFGGLMSLLAFVK